MDDIEKLIHELVKHGQSFKSYSLFLTNNSNLSITLKKIAEVCDRCHKNCYEVRQIVLENYKGEKDV